MDDEDYARDIVTVFCVGCAQEVYVANANYDELGRCWWCDECEAQESAAGGHDATE
jgi:hypothetical protein